MNGEVAMVEEKRPKKPVAKGMMLIRRLFIEVRKAYWHISPMFYILQYILMFYLSTINHPKLEIIPA
jgi:hypothetical protein